MKETPLKTPITIKVNSVERAIVLSAMMDGANYAKEQYLAGHNLVNGQRLVEFNNILTGGRPNSVALQIQDQLANQGIDWRRWEPTRDINIGSYKVEFKKGHINVGCKSVTNEQVKAVLKRLENPNSVSSGATVNTHGDAKLHKLVQEAALEAGWKNNCYVGSKIPGTNLLKPEYASLLFYADKTISGNVSHYTQGGYKNFDARTQFGEILDFFKSQGTNITIMGDKVEFGSSYGEPFAQFAGEKLTVATVRAIVAKLIN